MNTIIKSLLIVLSIGVFASCSKVEPCSETTSKCWHTLNNSCVVCVKSPTDSSLIVLSYSSTTDTTFMSSCDTTAWLAEARALDLRWKTDGDDYWIFFQSLYPNSCGCE
jgi:hypothetical protein